MDFINSIKDDDLREFLIMKEKQAEESKTLEEINKINFIINKKSNKLSKISKTIKNNKKDYQEKHNHVQDQEKKQELFHKVNEIIKNENKFSNFTITQLQHLYVFIILETKNKNLYKDYNKFYANYNLYCDKASEFINLFNFNKQNCYIEYLLKNNMKNNKLLNTIKCETIDKHFINKDDLFCYDVYDFEILKNELESIKKLMINLNNDIILNINLSDTINYKENKKKLIETFYNKFIKTYEICCIYNKPEILLYNKIINISKYTNEIVFVSMHFSLPIKFKKVLIADIFITLCINNIYHFCLVEYDGPTHYNIKDYRFNIEQIYRDITKNNFCKNNNISILRIFDYNENPENIVCNFINSIISNNGKPIINIPDAKYYENIINSYNQYC